MTFSTSGLGFKPALHVCNRTRLSLILHYCNFKYEIIGKTVEAMKLADETVQACMAKIEEVNEDDFIEATHICEIIKENISVWKGANPILGRDEIKVHDD